MSLKSVCILFVFDLYLIYSNIQLIYYNKFECTHSCCKVCYIYHMCLASNVKGYKTVSFIDTLLKSSFLVQQVDRSNCR